VQNAIEDSYSLWAAVAEKTSPSKEANCREEEQPAINMKHKSPLSAAASRAKERALALLRFHRQAGLDPNSIDEDMDKEFVLGIGESGSEATNLDPSGDGRCAADIAAAEQGPTILENTLHDVAVHSANETSERIVECPDATSPRPFSAAITKLEGEGAEACTRTEQSIDATSLAERIAQLPPSWRLTLLQHLEEAEADVNASSAADLSATTAGSPKSPLAASQGRHSWSSGGHTPDQQCRSGIAASEGGILESPPMF